MGKSDEAAASREEEAMQLAAAKQEYAEHMDSLRAEVKSILCNLLRNLSLSLSLSLSIIVIASEDPCCAAGHYLFVSFIFSECKIIIIIIAGESSMTVAFLLACLLCFARACWMINSWSSSNCKMKAPRTLWRKWCCCSYRILEESSRT
jgi:hypothetical protein